jgi:hypothetical protein
VQNVRFQTEIQRKEQICADRPKIRQSILYPHERLSRVAESILCPTAENSSAREPKSKIPPGAKFDQFRRQARHFGMVLIEASEHSRMPFRHG